MDGEERKSLLDSSEKVENPALSVYSLPVCTFVGRIRRNRLNAFVCTLGVCACPSKTDIKTILVLGSGPIVIGQGCEFDYSGTQACKAAKAEGYRIVLVNSNPATIMTDPQFSDRTYIEPITPESVRKIIELEQKKGPRIDAILPTLGGQTALNCACALWDNGTLTEFGIEMIGA